MNNMTARWGKIPHRLRSQALSLFDASRERMIWGLRGDASSAPILFRLTLHGRSIRVLELQPVRRAAGAVARARALGDNALAAE